MRPRNVLVAASAATALLASAAALSPTASATPGKSHDYLVLFKGTSADRSARDAIARAGGSLKEVNSQVGYAFVRSSERNFVSEVSSSGTVAGVARDRTIGTARDSKRPKRAAIERLTARERAAAKGVSAADGATSSAAAVTPEPLANRQWDMRQIGATADRLVRRAARAARGAGRRHRHRHRRHPPGHRAELRRRAQPQLRHRPAGHRRAVRAPACVDPANEDDDGHGTHVASTIGSPINGLGIAGVAPNVTLVNLRAGQDSGFFFLQPTLDALTYAGDIGVDVVNMSFYTDPWLFNCTEQPGRLAGRAGRAAGHPDGHPAGAQLRPSTTACCRSRPRATRHTDLGHPTSDDTSPDFPRRRGAPPRRRQLLHQRADRDARRAASAPPASAPARRTTPTTAPSRPTSRRPAATPTTRRTTPRDPRERRARRLPEALADANGELEPGRHPEHARSSSRTARAAPAPTTSTCRAPRWRRRTRSASRRSSSASSATRDARRRADAVDPAEDRVGSPALRAVAPLPRATVDFHLDADHRHAGTAESLGPLRRARRQQERVLRTWHRERVRRARSSLIGGPWWPGSTSPRPPRHPWSRPVGPAGALPGAQPTLASIVVLTMLVAVPSAETVASW